MSSFPRDVIDDAETVIDNHESAVNEEVAKIKFKQKKQQQIPQFGPEGQLLCHDCGKPIEQKRITAFLEDFDAFPRHCVNCAAKQG